MKRTIITVILSLALTAFAIQAVGQTALSGAGVIESTTGGFKFPDGSVQLSAANPPCTAITYLPYVITAEGVYCLTGNLETSITSGNAIEIQADNVVIDLNGWMLDGLGAGTATLARGIYANTRNNITIRNGTIRAFYSGIRLFEAHPHTTTQGHLIEYIRADRNRHGGIIILGSDCIVRHNQVVSTGGTTVAANDSSIGISIWGPGGRLIDNDIGNTTGTGTGAGVGLQIGYADGAVAEGNRIDSTSSELSVSHSINIAISNDVLVVGNRITNSQYGIYYETATGKYMDNLTSNVPAPYTGGTSSGSND